MLTLNTLFFDKLIIRPGSGDPISSVNQLRCDVMVTTHLPFSLSAFTVCVVSPAVCAHTYFSSVSPFLSDFSETLWNCSDELSLATSPTCWVFTAAFCFLLVLHPLLCTYPKHRCRWPVGGFCLLKFSFPHHSNKLLIFSLLALLCALFCAKHPKMIGSKVYPDCIFLDLCVILQESLLDADHHVAVALGPADNTCPAVRRHNFSIKKMWTWNE